LVVCVSQSVAVVGTVQADDKSALPSATAQQAAWHQGTVLAELAWLGNEATFHEQLTPLVVGDCLEIHGSVSSEANRNLAMKLAREASRMTTVDRMQISSAPLPQVRNRSLTMVYRDAVQAIYHECPKLSRSLTVTTQDRGEILVRGEVPTMEDRLAISRALKRVPGCSCVKNQVRARSVTVGSIGVQPNKPPARDNSLLVRMGLIQPRTESAPTRPMIARYSPSRELSPSPPVRSQLVALPVAAPVQKVVAQTIPAPVVTPTSLELPKASESPIVLTSAKPMSEVGRLRNCIALACGVPETAVSVAAKADKMLTVTLSVKDLESGRILGERVLAMPELFAYGVSLDVTVEK
jgi:hypothetical protein